MKVLLLLTSVIAVCNAESLDISVKLQREGDPIEFASLSPSGYNSADQKEHFLDELVDTENSPVKPAANEDQEFVDGPAGITDGPISTDIFTDDQQIKKTRKGQNEMKLRGKKDNKIFKKMSEDLETIKHNMTQAYLELKVELGSIKGHQANITNTIGTVLKEELQYIRDHNFNLTDIVTGFKTMMQSKLDSIKAVQGCPSGFFRLISSNQCFKIFTDSRMNWANANAKCRAAGLMFAEPRDPESVRAYLLKKYKLTSYTWVGAKGDGSYIRWLRGGDPIYSSSSLWYSSDPGSKVTTSYCLMILSTAGSHDPFHSATCSYGYAYPLCELVTSD